MTICGGLLELARCGESLCLLQRGDGKRCTFLGPNLTQEYGGHTDPWQEWWQAASCKQDGNNSPTSDWGMWLSNHYHHLLLGTLQAAPRTLHVVCESLTQKDTDNLEYLQQRAIRTTWSCNPCLWGQAEGPGLVQPEEEMAAGEPYNSTSYSWGGCEE